MVENTNFSLPVEFEQMSNVLDDRFTRVKIYIAHEGENRNRSIFTKEVLESMIPSLANVPILGYVAVDEDGNEDFLGHEEKLVVENGEFKLKYMGRAYGMIPEQNNARFETRYGSDGVERNYLVAEGLLWTGKFQEITSIFDRDGGFKGQSMELQPSSVKGYANEEGLFVFTSAKFEGLCILGENVTPAMISSTIERFSVADKVKIELSEMLDEFNAHFSTITEKGDGIVEQEKEILENEQTEFEATQTEETVVEEQQTEDAPENFEEQPVDETPADETPVDETPATEFEETPAVDETPVDEQPAKFTRLFELSHDDIRSGLYSALDQHDSFKESWMWISKVYDNHAIIEDESNGKYYKINYVKHESAVSLGDFEELFPMFLSASEKASVDASRNNFEALEQEVQQLREFKANSELAEKEQKLASYSASLSKEEYATIKENLANFSMTDIEKEIGFLLLKKNHFSANKQEEAQNRVHATNTVDANPYASLSSYFTK